VPIVTRQTSNGEINRELTTLKRAFRLAVQAGKLITKPHIPLLQEDNVRTGFFEPEQHLSVIAHLPAHLRTIITFAYDDGSGATTAPQTNSETGGSTAWNFNGSGNADGFGVFERNDDKGSGNENTAGTTNWLVFTLAGVPSNLNNWDLAAHVQYNDGCSGWVSDRTHPHPGSSAECGSARVPEPSAMILFGVGLVSLATWARRRFREGV